MKPSAYLFILGGAFVAAAGISFWQGSRGRELAAQAITHGLVLGAGISVAAWLVSQNREERPVTVPVSTPGTSFLGDAVALANSISGAAKIGREATQLLSQIDPEALYKPLESAAMRVTGVPENEYSVNQKA